MSLSIEHIGANSFVTVLALHSHEEYCADVTADKGRMETCVQRYRTVGARRRPVHVGDEKENTCLQHVDTVRRMLLC